MKKSMIVVLALVSALMVLCAACGSSSDTAEVSATAAPAEEEETVTVTVTPPPAEDNEAPTVTAEPEAQSDTEDSADDAEDEDVPEDLATAQGMIGQSVSDLYAAIGEPESSEYTESCLVEDGQDGLLYYDGFIVSTVQYTDGTEVVMGAY